MYTRTVGGTGRRRFWCIKNDCFALGADWEWLSAGQNLGHNRRGGTTVQGMKWEQKKLSCLYLVPSSASFLPVLLGDLREAGLCHRGKQRMAQSKRKAKGGHLNGVYCGGERVLQESLVRRLRPQRWILMAFPFCPAAGLDAVPDKLSWSTHILTPTDLQLKRKAGFILPALD